MIDITKEKTKTGYKYTLNDSNLDYTNSLEISRESILAYFGGLDSMDNDVKNMLTTKYLLENKYDAGKTIADLIPFYAEN